MYQHFNKRADTLMDLLDALCSNHNARHVGELSLEPAFGRHYTALFQAVGKYHPQPGELAHLAAEHAPQKRAFGLIGIDVTSQPRESASTLDDCTFVYKPGVIQGNKSVTIGHQYSTVALLPEKDADTPVPWMVLLSCEGVPSEKRKFAGGKEQIEALLSDPQMPFHGQLVVEAADSDYAGPVLNIVYTDNR